MRRLVQYILRYRWRLLWGSMLLLGTNLLAITIPQFFRFAVDGLNSGSALEDLKNLAAMLILVAIAGAILRTLSRIHIFYVGRDIEMDLRVALYRHLSTMGSKFYQVHSPGDLMSRATSDLAQVRAMMGPGFLNIVNTAIAYATALPPMLAISPKLTLLTLAVYPPALFLIMRLSKGLYARNRVQQAAAGKIAGFVQETLGGMSVIRAFAQEDEREQSFSELNQNYYDAAIRLTLVRSTLWRMMGTIGALGVLLAFFLGVRDVLNETLSVGELIAMVEYMALLSWPTFAMGWMISLWQRGKAAMSRLNEILEYEAEVKPGALSPENLESSIVAQDLSLELDGRKILKNIKISADAGETVGIVGPIGSGKTVLARALMRLYNIQKNTVSLGGIDVCDLSFESLRTQWAYVPQHHTLFSRTLADNVRFGRMDDATTEDILEALNDAAFENDLAALPLGLETQVGERGVSLSGGQKQRTAIARALLVDAPILLLDDVLSAVDAETESHILSRVEKKRRGKTNIVISHRMSAVRDADRIYVLKEGEIVSVGDHNSLMQETSWYRAMVELQALEAEDAQEQKRDAS